jgi:hypothetical protein
MADIWREQATLNEAISEREVALEQFQMQFLKVDPRF